MGNVTEELIHKAAAVVNPQTIGDRLVGDVGCALVTDKGNIYLGVCLDLPSGTGFCVEAGSIAAMVTAGELRISQIVAVWKDEEDRIYVVSPCGRYREFIRRMHRDNLDTDIVLGRDKIVKLRELLPLLDVFTPVGPPEE
jgi:cytidine deaminase